ncbi:MAG: sulfite exporter TauE/SafE family protein [Proteobacteria bacterium]|nr:MAG: sulfite exporter TauE/SafE family protein [Pseudomonadota bacterium]
MSTTEAFAIVLPALFFGGFVKGAVGFGIPLVATPILLFFLPLPQIISLYAFPVIASNIQQLWLTRKHGNVIRVVWPLIVTNAIVLLLGSHLIVSMDGDRIRVIVGCFIIVHAVLMDRSYSPSARKPDSLIAAGFAGTLSGVIGSLSSFFFFPAVQLLHSMRLDPPAFVYATGLFLISGFAALWLGVFVHGGAAIENVGYSAMAVVPVALGVWAGNRTRQKMDSQKFYPLVGVTLFLVGVSLVVRSL